MPLSRKLALLGVLSALNCVVRLLGVGFAGIETAFALIILAGYCLGPRFGFSLGLISITASSLISGGIGPWLPFQLIATACVGFGAGLLPKNLKEKTELLWLCLYAIVASYAYGAFLTFCTWPLFVGSGTSVSFLAGGSLLENLVRFVRFEFFSGGLIWDTGRAVTTVVLILLIGKALMATLERATTRANYELN